MLLSSRLALRTNSVALGLRGYARRLSLRSNSIALGLDGFANHSIMAKASLGTHGAVLLAFDARHLAIHNFRGHRTAELAFNTVAPHGRSVTRKVTPIIPND